MRATSAGAPEGARAFPLASTSPPEVDARICWRCVRMTWCIALSSRRISASEGAPGDGPVSGAVVAAGFTLAGVGALGPRTDRRDCTKLRPASESWWRRRGGRVDVERFVVEVVVTRTSAVAVWSPVARAPAFAEASSRGAVPQPDRASRANATGRPARRSSDREPPLTAPRLAGRPPKARRLFTMTRDPVPAGPRREERIMIARIWKGTVRRADADEYAAYIGETGFAAYGETAGNRGAWMLRRDEGDRTTFQTWSLWEDEEAIRAFAGDDIEAAVYYPEDERYLVDQDATVTHYDVVD